MTPTSWLLAPDEPATAVRDELALTGKPPKRPAATLAAPRATISWFGSTTSRRRSAMLRDRAEVSARVTNAMPMAATASRPRSSALTCGRWGEGKPVGIGPTTGTSRSKATTIKMAPITATRTPGMAGSQRRQPRMTAMQPRPMTSAVGSASPSATPRPQARSSGQKPSASMEKPNSFGSWLTTTMMAMPLR